MKPTSRTEKKSKSRGTHILKFHKRENDLKTELKEQLEEKEDNQN